MDDTERMCTHAGVISKAECPWCKDDRIAQLEAELADVRKTLKAVWDERDRALAELKEKIK